MQLTKPQFKQVIIIALTGLIVGTAAIAFAEGISGYAEYNYSLLNSTTTEPAGKTKTKSSVFNQRYNLTMDKDIYPTLRFIGGASFEKNDSDNDINSQSSSGSASRIYPTADLSYSNGPFNGGLGFSRRQESTQFNGVASSDLFFDSYNARFGWRPEGFPSLDILYSTFDNYDEHRSNQDSTNSSLTISSRFKPLESLDISYQTNYSTLTNNLAGFESQSLNQNLRLAYNDILFRDRISISTSYNIATQNTKAENKGSGPAIGLAEQKSVNQLFFASTDTAANAIAGNNPFNTPSFAGANNAFFVTPPPPSTDNPNPGNLSGVAGTVILGNGIEAKLRNVGIRSISKVNIVRLLVSINPRHELNATDVTEISQAFQFSDPSTSKIRVYHNPAQDGTTWERINGATITFGTFTNTVSNSPGFEIQLPQVLAENDLIKVEVETVSRNLSFIQTITLMSAEVYLQETTPLQAGQSRTSSQLSGLYNLNLKAKVLDSPMIYYDLGFNLDHTSSDTQNLTYRYSIINGLSLNHRFNQKLSISARAAREDAVEPQVSSRSSNSASVSLSAQPLPTLTQTANYSFRQETDNSLTKNTHSMNISNSAELYQGVSFNLTGGGSLLTDSAGADQKSITITSGLNLLPHRTLSINLSISDSRAWTSGRNKPEESFSTETADLAINYNPLPNIYLFGSYVINAQKGRKVQTAQSIGGTWSPFRGGAVLLNTSYRENIDSSGNKDRTAVQSVRWNIRAGWFLDVSYLISTGTTISRTTDTQVFSTSLRMSF